MSAAGENILGYKDRETEGMDFGRNLKFVRWTWKSKAINKLDAWRRKTTVSQNLSWERQKGDKKRKER